MSSLANLLNLTTDELREQFKKAGIEPYRAEQIHQWIFEKGVYEFDKMSNLPAELREKLKEHFSIVLPPVAGKEKATDDKSTKILLKLNEKDYVEAVYMPMKDRRTVCISSQVGCKFHCAFCASGQEGFFRNLTMGEILAQVLLARDISSDKKITNIVFMGIGEPFDNYKELLRTIRMLNSKKGFKLGARKITVSTCGVVPKIEMFSEEGLQVELSVSLHGPNDNVRGAIMPVNQAYPVKSLMEACRKYVKKTSRAITFEYILIRGINSGPKEAQELSKILKGLICKVNLIPYNSIEEFPHVAPTYEEIIRFQQILQRNNIRTTVRFSKGRQIQAACGQLRVKNIKAGKASGGKNGSLKSA